MNLLRLLLLFFHGCKFDSLQRCPVIFRLKAVIAVRLHFRHAVFQKLQNGLQQRSLVAEEKAPSQWDAKNHLPEAAIGCRALSPGCSQELSGHEQLEAGNTTQMQPEPHVLHLKVPLSGRRNIFSPHRLLPGSYEAIL